MWKFLVKNQSIEIIEREVLADHQIQYVQFRFTFDGDWRRFHKVVQFTQCDETYNIVLGTDGTSLYLPAELHVGAAKMSVFGYDTDSDTTVRATTVPVTLNIRPSGFVGDDEPPIPPTPDLYAQLLKKIEEAGHGADGKSAYEIAVEHGYVGTETEWLASLKGEPGETQDMSEYPKTSEVTIIVEREIEAATGDFHSHTIDFLNKKRGKNNGVLPQYYIEDDHEAIIPKEIYMKVQEEMARRSSERDKNGIRRGFSANNPFSQIITCECCGAQYRRIHWYNHGKKSIVWRCKTRMEDKTACNSRTIHEDLLQQAFVDALNEMIENSDGYLSHLKENLKTAINLCNPQSAEALAARMNQLQQELIDRTESRQNYDDLVEEILLLREQQEQTNMDEAAKAEHRDRIQALCNFINSQPRTITKFDGTLVRKLLKDVKVCDVFIEFRFKSGTSVIIEK
nr:MAG TPA: integrase [Caudoviricetes sp.]